MPKFPVPDICTLESEADLLAARTVFTTAMVGLPVGAVPEPQQILTMRQPGRTLGVFDDDSLVGSVLGFAAELVVLGGARVPHLAVTGVGVLPTHTRRGIVSSLLKEQLRDARRRGEIAATLRASEATIYGRYGYGVATTSTTIDVTTARAHLRPDIAQGGRVRMITADAAADVLPEIYARNPSTVPGTISRPSTWWAGHRYHASKSTDPSYVAVHGDPGAETGFVSYHGIDAGQWFTSDRRTVVVDDLWAPSPESYIALIRFLLSLDLVDRFVFESMPVDALLPHLFIDRRAAKVTDFGDETWLRLVDVEKALAARTYPAGDSIVIAVDDAVLPENSGRYSLSARGVERVDGPADVTFGIAALAEVYLGGVRPSTLVAAGTVTAAEPAAIAAADRLFTSPIAPHCGTDF